MSNHLEQMGRAIIDFFLSPLRKSGQEAFKER